MASRTQPRGATKRTPTAADVQAGQVRECARYRGELARHRVITADAQDFVVATADERHLGRGYATAAYPVSRGYLVMMRQPLCTMLSREESEARSQHELLVRVLAEAGSGVVRARRRSAAWRRAERTPASATSGQAVQVEMRDLATATSSAESVEIPA